MTKRRKYGILYLVWFGVCGKANKGIAEYLSEEGMRLTEIQTWEKNPFTMSAASLAYMGDAVYEVMVREMLVREGVRQPSVASLQYVTATAQCRILEAIQSLLTEPETEMYRRGRNCVHNMPPKSCTMAEYRRATGLETLFGYLWLAGERERLHTLFQTGVDALRSVTQ